MSNGRWRRLLVPIFSAIAVLVPAGLAAAACPLRPPPPCKPAAFTGSVHAHQAACRTPAPASCNRGERGRRGAKGKTGETGRRGETGLTGATGETGSTGSTGPQGLPGNQGPPGEAGATGAAGATGPQGLPGPEGPAGATGTTGAAGAAGEQGETGLTGAAGAPGATGATGPTGPQGLPGVQGESGPAGAAGTAGAEGPQGADGPTGPQGETGEAGAEGPIGPSRVPEYAYVYNTGAETVPVEADIAFDSNGLTTATITHAPGATQIVLGTTGTYTVTTSISGVEPGQFTLFLNGAPLDGSTYGSGAGTQQNLGQTILTASAGDVLTLRNHSSAAAVTLQTLAGGTQANVNASVLIEKIG